MKTQITGKTQLKISALSKNVPGTYFYEARNWNRGSQFQNEVISHATQKKRKNSHNTGQNGVLGIWWLIGVTYVLV